MGHVDESLQVFLQCLALDENFHQAKQEVEMVRLISLFLYIVGVMIKIGLQYVTNLYFSIDTKLTFFLPTNKHPQVTDLNNNRANPSYIINNNNIIILVYHNNNITILII